MDRRPLVSIIPRGRLRCATPFCWRMWAIALVNTEPLCADLTVHMCVLQVQGSAEWKDAREHQVAGRSGHTP